MSELQLNSLEIRNFRTFRHLRIERLGRVNLIVGKNSVGKTSLLEALRLYALQGAPATLLDLLSAREEVSLPASGEIIETRELLEALRNLFFERKEIKYSSETLQIGALDTPEKRVSIGMGLHARYSNGNSHDGSQTWRLLSPEEYSAAENPSLRLDVQIGNQQGISFPLETDLRVRFIMPGAQELPCIFLDANGLSNREIGQLWDKITLTDFEDDVIRALKIIIKDVQRLNLMAERGPSNDRIPKARVAGVDGPVALRSLGGGMVRLFGIALALVNAANGLLLIDEVESGLHYSVQVDMWRLILQLASRLNVQVFATTHSWDCIEAFQQAAQEDHQEQGMLIRLGRKRGQVVATLFDEQELAIATREQIEVR